MRTHGPAAGLRHKLELIRAKPSRGGGPKPTPVPPSDDELAGFYRRFAGINIGAPLETPPSDGDAALFAVGIQAAALGKLRDGELQATFEATLKAAETAHPEASRRDLLDRGLTMLRMEAVRRGLLFAVPVSANVAGNPVPQEIKPRRRSPVVAARLGLADSLQPFFSNHASTARNVEWALAEEGLAEVLSALKREPERFGKPVGAGPRGTHGELNAGVEAAVRALAGLVPPRSTGRA